MTPVLHDYLPDAITQGEQAAIADATSSGWINPPVYCSWQAEPMRSWRSVHLRYLERRGLIGQWRRRRDGMWCVRLNGQGLELRSLLASPQPMSLAA